MRVKPVGIFVSLAGLCLFASVSIAAPPTYTISGVVVTAGGTGVEGVDVVGDNGAGAAVTAADGTYSIIVPNHWTGTVTVSKTGFLLTPPSNTYTKVSADITAQNYTAYQPTISGFVKKTDGTPLEGATVTANNGGGSASTDVSGYYEIIVPYGWSGKIIPVKIGLAFDPIFIDYNDVTEDLEIQNFTTYSNPYGGGSGTEEDPYLIISGSQLCNLGSRSEDWDKHFLMIADVNMVSIDPSMFNPIGNSIVPFTGTFDGQNHTIHKFECNANYYYVGLFGRVIDPYAVISNVHLNEPNIIALSQNKVAALVGYLQGGSVLNCSVTSGSIVGGNYVGGIIGESKEASITKCHAKETSISGQYYIGGLIGYSWLDNINLSFSECELQGYKNIGGLIGWSYGSIANECYATGVVLGEDDVGGLVGYFLVTTDTVHVKNCYAACIVDANDGTAGGLIAFGAGGSDDVVNSYWDINVSGQAGSSGGTGKTTEEMYTYATYYGWGCSELWVLDEGNDYPRLYFQQAPGTIINPNGYSGGSGQIDDPYLINSLEDLLWMTVFPCDWDENFTMTSDIDLSGYDSLAPIGEYGNIPFTGTFDGNGHTITNYSYSDLNGDQYGVGLFGYVFGENAVIKNLNLTNCNIITGHNATGTLAGVIESSTVMNCRVFGCTISVSGGASVGGLIGRVQNGYVADCSVEAGQINSDEPDVGGLIGHTEESDILRSYASTNIQGTGEHSIGYGGLIASAAHSTISQCYATGNVTAHWGAGGLVGGSSSFIEDCYATGDVETTGDDWWICPYVGGFIGSTGQSCHIDNCYSTGDVTRPSGAMNGYSGGFIGDDSATVVNCFWDIQTSGYSSSDGGIGKTTAEMQTQSTFTGAGWDFIYETNNGYADIWAMPTEGGYPLLWWQLDPLPPLPEFSGGSGTPADPFIITNAAELAYIGNQRLSGKHYKSANDIDANGLNLSPIGKRLYPFTGVFDGDNNIVFNIQIDAPEDDYVGLFGYISDGSKIKNISLVNANITGRDYVGSLIGFNEGAPVENCICVVDVSGNQYVGGLAGYSVVSPISDCQSTGNITGYRYAGGLIGYAGGTDIQRCFSNSTVNASYYAGGLIGSLTTSTITDCSSSGNTIASGNTCGGLIGLTSNSNISRSNSSSHVSGIQGVGGFIGGGYDVVIARCYANGNISGTEFLGGFAGSLSGDVTESYSAGNVDGLNEVGGFIGSNRCNVSNCYALGDIYGQEITGGFIGDNSGDIIYSYSAGIVSAPADANYIGGFVGRTYKPSLSCYWDIQTSGQTHSATGIGKTTEEMLDKNTYIGWGCEPAWLIHDTVNYPHLSWQDGSGEQLTMPTYAGGNGTPEDPFLINTSEQLNSIGLVKCHQDKNFKLISDIDMSGIEGDAFNSIGPSHRNSFTGTFDGDNFDITNLTIDIDASQFGGLFNKVDGPNAIIMNMGLIAPNIYGEIEGFPAGSLVCVLWGGTISNCWVSGGNIRNSDIAGGLVCYSHGRIIDCYAETTVCSTEGSAGGLLAANTSEITNCHTSCNVSGGGLYVGGLAGSNAVDGLISNCSASGSVSGYNIVGGLVGKNEHNAVINASYSTCNVSGRENVGGLVGFHSGQDIINCYSRGSVHGETNVGGLLGRTVSDGNIVNCYAASIVDAIGLSGGFVGNEFDNQSNFSKCFWDTDACSQLTGIGNSTDPDVTGLTTNQMQIKPTYTGWNFVNDWMMLREYEDYPRLAWQTIFAGDIAGQYGVDMVDFAYLANYWGLTGCNSGTDCGRADIDASGGVGLPDLLELAYDWLSP